VLISVIIINCNRATQIVFFYDNIIKIFFKIIFIQDKSQSPGVLIRILSGLTTGVVSVSVAQPTEVVKIRMQVMGTGWARVYKGTMQAYMDIARTERLPGLWRGLHFIISQLVFLI